jgi:hypothetical protein
MQGGLNSYKAVAHLKTRVFWTFVLHASCEEESRFERGVTEL